MQLVINAGKITYLKKRGKVALANAQLLSILHLIGLQGNIL